MIVTFATNAVLASADIFGIAPDPFERLAAPDYAVRLGIDLPAIGISRDTVSSNACSVDGEVAEDGWSKQSKGSCR